MNQTRSKWIAVCIFSLPTLMFFSLIVMYPTVKTLVMSSYDWDGIMPGVFTGTKNFKKLLIDPIFFISLRNCILFAIVMTVYQLGLGTFFALALVSGSVWGKNVLRKVYFIPVVLSVTVVCQLWLSIYNPEYGLINKLFELCGLSFRQNWLSSMNLPSILAIAFVSSWQGMGYQLTLLYAGAKSIPAEIFEAARIDGASTFKAHSHITIPLMAETYRICLIFTITAGLNAFAHMQIMTKGGPGTATYTLTYMMYRSAFQVDEYGYGCAAAVVLVFFCLLMTLTINRFVARERIIY